MTDSKLAMIERIDRWNVSYRKGERSLLIPAEGSFDGSILALYLEGIEAWDPPHSSDRISEVEFAGIREDLVRYFAEDDVAVEFDPVQ